MRIISGIVSTVANIATLVSYQTLLIANVTNRAALIFTDSNILLTFDKKQNHWQEFITSQCWLQV